MTGQAQSHDASTLFKRFFSEAASSGRDLNRDDVFSFLSRDDSSMRYVLTIASNFANSNKTIGDGLCCPRSLEMLRKRYEFFQKYGNSSAKSYVPADYNLYDEKQRDIFIKNAFDPEIVDLLTETNQRFVTLAKEWVTKPNEDDSRTYCNPNRTALQLREAYGTYTTIFPRLPSVINGLPIWADQDYCRQVYPHGKFPRTLFVEYNFGGTPSKNNEVESSGLSSLSISSSSSSNPFNFASTILSSSLSSSAAAPAAFPTVTTDEPKPAVAETHVTLYYSSVCDSSTDSFLYSQLRSIVASPFPNYFCLSGNHFFLLDEPDEFEALRIEEALKSLSSMISRAWEERIKPHFLSALQREENSSSNGNFFSFFPSLPLPPSPKIDCPVM